MYLSVLECVFEEKAFGFVAHGASVSFCLDWQQKWVRLVFCDMVAPGGQADPEGAPACPTLRYSMGGGGSPKQGGGK